MPAMVHKAEGKRKYLGKTKSAKDAKNRIQSIYEGKHRYIKCYKVNWLKDLNRLQGWNATGAHHIYVVGNEGHVVGSYFVLNNGSVYAISHNHKRAVFGKW